MTAPMLTLLDIQRMSSEDGPGLRTTAFLKGCTLACAWCHNPESIASKGEVLWHVSRCMGCASCVAICPEQGIRQEAKGLTIERTRCRACFSCVAACPTGAVEAKGKPIEVEELARELLKDRAYFGEDGGITISGGEALHQPESIELLRVLRNSGVAVAIDTCGHIGTERLLRALDFASLVLFDLKLADDAAHSQWTGVGNALILENLALVLDWAQRTDGGRLWIRTPIIPGATDSHENIRALAQILATTLEKLSASPEAVERWELCAFNNLCIAKYKSRGELWEFAQAQLMTTERMEELALLARAHVDIKDIRATGATQ